MKRNELHRSEFEEQEEWEEEELETHPDRYTNEDIIDPVSSNILNNARQRNLEILREKGIGHSKKPKKLNDGRE